MTGACGPCLARSWLLRALAGHLHPARSELDEVLGLPDRDLIAAVGGRRRRELERRLARAHPERLREAAHDRGLNVICRCDAGYPHRLHELQAPPSVLFVAGELESFLDAMAQEPVAIVGARRASSYGLEVARSVARGLAASGLAVISGMAAGIDSAAHEGALTADAIGVAVLPGPADDPYPSSRRRLYRQLTRSGAAVSELPPATPVRRWMFIARNRIIAALSAATIVVEASDRSGALVTAAVARGLGRPVGAVPGRITTPQAAGANALLADGAFVARGAQDVLDAIYGIGVRCADSPQRPTLGSDADAVLQAIAAGGGCPDAVTAADITPGRTLAALAWLELSGYIRREPGGSFAVIP